MKRGKAEIPRTVYLDGYSDEHVRNFEGKRQWLGYRQVDINLSSISDSSLIEYVAKTGIYCNKPKRVLIPSEILSRYHLDGLFFKIYNEQWGRPHGMCHCVASGRLFQELLYSESHTEIMRAVTNKGLLKKLIDLERKRKRDLEKDVGFRISFADNVTSPEQEILRDKLKALNEAELFEYAKEHLSHIIIGAPGS